VSVARPWLLRGLIVALLAAVVALVLVLSGDDDDGTLADAVPPRIVSVEELREEASDSPFPIYWAGPIDEARLELTQGSDGSALLRYLPLGTPLGGAGETAVSVGTYPLADAAAATAGLAAQPGATIRSGPGGRTVIAPAEAPRSAYFAAPGNVQVEVYAPAPRRALRLAASPQVRTVE